MLFSVKLEFMEEAKTPEVAEKNMSIDVVPLSKGQRILSYFADLFLCLILAFTLFHLVVHPIGRRITSYDEKQTESLRIENEMHDVLYGNDLLFSSSTADSESDRFSIDLGYTFDQYAYFYVVDASKTEYEVFRHYAVDLQKDESLYLSFYQNCATARDFFDLTGSSPVLKESYKTEFAPKWAPKDSLSEQGEKDYQTWLEKVFLPLYSAMLSHAESHGLTFTASDGQTLDYAVLKKTLDQNNELVQDLAVLSAFIAEAIALVLYYWVLPLCLPHRKTLGRLFLRQSRVSLEGLSILPRKRLWAPFLSSVFASSWVLFLLPWPIVSFNALFGLPWLLEISALSLLYALVSFAFILADPFGRSLSDRSTLTLLIRDDDLDAVYAKKGYQ